MPNSSLKNVRKIVEGEKARRQIPRSVVVALIITGRPVLISTCTLPTGTKPKNTVRKAAVW